MRADLTSSHRTEYGVDPEVVVSAPGSVNLMGEHTEYSDGFVLPIAINRSVSIAVSRRKDNSLRFFAADFNERKRTSVSNLKYKREDRWANYIKGVLYMLIQIGCPVKGLDITISGNVPAAVGLSSSSAITIATAVAIKTIYQFKVSDIQLVQCARLAEKQFMGKDVGVLGTIVSYYAKEKHALLIDTRSLEFRHVPVDLADAEICITDSKVPVISADSEFTQRREDCRTCVAALSRRKSGTALRDYTAADLRESMGSIPESVRRRCLHVVDENQRVLDTQDALAKRDPQLMGKLMNRSHESLRDLFEVSCPELDWLVKRAIEIDGVFGSRMTGAGFGGCTVTLLRRSAADEYRKKLDEYERIFGFKAEAFLTEPSQGVRILHHAKP
jgi:galactokinase